jgi:hypothetical protein
MASRISRMFPTSMRPTWACPNEVSGVAITAAAARQRYRHRHLSRQSDLAQEECGRTMNELIGHLYDTPRIVKTIGPDAKRQNDGDQSGWPAGNGHNRGQVRRHGEDRAELRHQAHRSQESMMAFINAMPQHGRLHADLVADMMDWPDAQKISRRMRLMLPPGIAGSARHDAGGTARAAGAQQAPPSNRNHAAPNGHGAVSQNVIGSRGECLARPRL